MNQMTQITDQEGMAFHPPIRVIWSICGSYIREIRGKTPMKLLAAPALAALLLLPSPLRAEAPAPAKPPRTAAIDALSEADLDEIETLLRDHYIAPDALSEEQLKRATIQGLLDRIGPGASILRASAATEATVSPFKSEVLDGRIGYVRIGSLSAENLGHLDAALQDFAARPLSSLVIDLRATPPGSEFEQAAEVCRRLTPKGKVLFTVKKPKADEEQVLTSKDEPKFRGVIVALVDHDTAGNAEVIAAVLRTHAHALIIGQATKGEAVEFAELPLPGGSFLRVAVSEVTLPDSAPVFPGGLKPDLVVEVAQEATDELLKQELERGVSEFVFETERPRMNEAALVAGISPELDSIQAAQKLKGEKPRPPLRDTVLQRAVDFITSLPLFEK